MRFSYRLVLYEQLYICYKFDFILWNTEWKRKQSKMVSKSGNYVILECFNATCMKEQNNKHT